MPDTGACCLLGLWKVRDRLFTRNLPPARQGRLCYCFDSVSAAVDTEIPYRLPFWRELCWVLQVCVASGVDTEFPYRVRIVDRGVDCRDPVCRHHFRFPEGKRLVQIQGGGTFGRRNQMNGST